MDTGLPPLEQERIVCAITAAVKYDIAANIMLAVADKERGKPGQWVLNTNGTHDVGWLQFNTRYLRDLASYGISADDVASNGCYAFDLAAWRIRNHIDYDSGDIWTRVANYHSRTPEFNNIYRRDLIKKAIKWADWLETRFDTEVGSFVINQAEKKTQQPIRNINTEEKANTSVYVPRTVTVAP